MNNFWRTGLKALLFAFLLFHAAAENSWREGLTEAEIHFINGRYDSSEAVLDSLLSAPASEEDSWATLLKSGNAFLWKGRIALERRDETGAEGHLWEAVETAEKLRAEAAAGNNMLLAESYLLEAEARTEIMLFKGVGFIIKNGPLVQELAEKTLALDPSNPEALVIYAQGRINAPRLFGGNKKEGMQILEDLWLRYPGGRTGQAMTVAQAYRVAVSLGEILAGTDPEAAERYFSAALTLAPGSPRAREGLEGLK